MADQAIRVLLIEDDPDHAELVQRQLKLIESPRVETRWCDRLAAGLQALETEPPAAVLLDLRLPDSDQSSTLSRALAAAGPTPIIVLTSLGDFESGADAVKQGAQDFLMKSACSSEVLARSLIYAVERKRQQLELHRYATELERSNRELDNFARIVAHDLKSPLAVVQMILRQVVTQLGEVPADVQRSLGDADQSVQNMMDLVDDLLRLARLGSQGVELVAVDCEELLTDVLTGLRPQLDAAGAEVTHDRLPTVTGDWALLLQVLQNLIANAVRYCDGAPRIHVSAELFDEDWVFSVSDNGIGVPAGQHDTIFEMFARADPERCEGSGVGLAVCKRAVTAHGGRIWVAANADGGSTFYFTLPLRRSPAEPLRTAVG